MRNATARVKVKGTTRRTEKNAKVSKNSKKGFLGVLKVNRAGEREAPLGGEFADLHLKIDEIKEEQQFLNLYSKGLTMN